MGETCFSYEIDMRNNNNGENDASTCEASYGGNQCDCMIDGNFCLTIDCTPFLEGGKMDTCQMLSMINADDVANWFPNFDAFLPGFEGGGSIIDGGLPPALDGSVGEWEEDSNDNSVWNEEVEEEEDDNDVWNDDNKNREEGENETNDVTIPARPLEPIDGDIVVLQASELVNSGAGSNRYSGMMASSTTGFAA